MLNITVSKYQNLVSSQDTFLYKFIKKKTETVCLAIPYQLTPFN